MKLYVRRNTHIQCIKKMLATDSLIKFWFNVNHFQTINSILSYNV